MPGLLESDGDCREAYEWVAQEGRKVKIIAVADLHGNLPADIPECDLLLLAGDICPNYTGDNIRGQRKWLDTKFRSWLQTLPTKKTIAIWGNHDFIGESPKNLPVLDWLLLEDAETTVEGLRVYGTPYVSRFMNWAFMETEAQLEKRFSSIPDGLDILISHGPPLLVCDRMDDGNRVGSKALYDRLRTMPNPPHHVICGHIHSGRGWGTMFGEHGSVQVWNVAGVDETYTPRQPMWMEIDLAKEVIPSEAVG